MKIMARGNEAVHIDKVARLVLTRRVALAGLPRAVKCQRASSCSPEPVTRDYLGL